MALIDKLSAIGDAIREKNGTTDLIPLGDMPAAIEAIQAGGELPEEAFMITGNCTYRFSQNGWNWFIDLYGDKVITKDLTLMNGMFSQSSNLQEIPFEINIILNCKNMAYLFDSCKALKAVPLIKGELSAPTGNYSGVLDMSYMFQGCNNLKEIPYDYFYNFGGEAFWEASQIYQASRNYLFYGCYSLRALPDISMLTTNGAYYNCLYYSLAGSCYALDEIVNLPVNTLPTYTSNCFNTFSFNNTSRIKNLTFALLDDAPYAVNWKSQTIDLTSYVGYCQYSSNILYYNSGITADKEVKDDATYQALKDNPDWFSCKVAYSRYNHDSAVATINSLPDTSAYLATAGGTNTIKFRGTAGSATDGGAINTLTEEEIAVATAKGWTVTLV